MASEKTLALRQLDAAKGELGAADGDAKHDLTHDEIEAVKLHYKALSGRYRNDGREKAGRPVGRVRCKCGTMRKATARCTFCS